MTMDVSLVIGGLKGILENLCDNYSDSIIGQAASTSRDYLKNRNVDSKIKEVASCLTGLKCRDDTLFLSDLQAAFSKDNLQKILKEIRKDDAFDMEEALRQKLGDLCETYYVENADKIIDSLVQMFFELTATNNPELEGRLFFNRISRNQQEIKTLLVTELLEIKNELSFISEVSYGLRKSDSERVYTENGTVVGDDEDLFAWNLKFYQTKGLFGSNEKRKAEVEELTKYWRKERELYPGWYIVPVTKREILKSYTRDESLLWKTTGMSIQEKIDFAFELVWRYETGFIVFSKILQNHIFELWKEYKDNGDWSLQDKNKKWFYIGQSLLREYREDMNWNSWQKVFDVMKKSADIKRILKDLEAGKVDIIIGTHRLTSNDIKFKDLGLLVIDEEQKFGVAVKEKLKRLKLNVDTITMTATPIPRTLQFSLMGARDMSIIRTAPPNRYPIVTELHRFDEKVIKDAISYEVSRGGQSDRPRAGTRH